MYFIWEVFNFKIVKFKFRESKNFYLQIFKFQKLQIWDKTWLLPICMGNMRFILYNLKLCKNKKMVTERLELSTLALLARCSDQLSYATYWCLCLLITFKLYVPLTHLEVTPFTAIILRIMFRFHNYKILRLCYLTISKNHKVEIKRFKNFKTNFDESF